MSKSGRLHVYQPHWYEGGINPETHRDHKDYVRQLCYHLIEDVTDLIDKARKGQNELVRNSEYYTDYQEVLHHLHFCNLKCETFCGREDVLQKAKDYILNDKSRKPLILYAPSGAGKTSVMAKIMQRLPEWFNKQPYVGVIQFLGTSPLSINIYDVLYGVCGQLADCAQILMEPVGYRTMKNMLEYLPRFLRRVSSKLKKPIVILLDSLDQLLPNNNAHLCKWLPTMLPSNLRIIVSTLPEEHEILDTLQTIFPDTSNFVEVPAMPDEAGFEMIDKYLEKKKRTVTEYQTKQIIQAFRKCRGPLYLKLVLDEAVSWNSYTPDHALVLQDTVQGAINQLFDNMEKKFGSILIGHALGYITVAINGISDIEWEDVLSCDDEVLDDIYRYHNPPVPGIVRLPPVLVARIRYDLREYIVERRSFGKTTLNWYHRQFIQTAHTRYAVGISGKKIHKVLAEYFIANDGIKRDITLHRRKLTVEKADRQVTKQPLIVKNKRKLTAVPYHITHAGDQIDPSKAKRDCFCNLDFLRIRIASLPLSSLVEDMTKYLDKIDDEEVAFLRNYFMVTKTEIGTSGTSLAINLLSKLHIDDSQKYLKELIQQAKDLVYSNKSPLLIPVFPCMAERKDASPALLQIYNDIDNITAESQEAFLMTNVKGEETDEGHLSVYDATNGEMYCLVPNKDFITTTRPLLDPSEKRVIQFGKDRLKTFHFHSQAINEKKFTEICDEIDVEKSYPMMSTLSTDSMHLTMLFSNGDVLTFDTNGFKKVDLMTLREEPNEVANIITTTVDNLKVILTINSDVQQKENGEGGCVRVHVVGAAENGKMLKIIRPFNKGLAAVGYNETLLVGCSNKENKGTLTVIDLDNVKTTITEDCSKLMQLSVSHSHAMAAVWLEVGSIAIYDISKGETIQELHINNTITSFGISWINDLVLIGDNQGQIIMYKGQTGKHFGDFRADCDEIVKVSVLDDQIVTLSRKNTVKIWQISTLLNTEREKVRTAEQADGTDLLSQKEILGFDVDIQGQNIITASEDKTMRVWSINNVQLQKKIYLGIMGNKLLSAINSLCVVLDNISNTLKIINYKEGVEKMAFRNVVDFCIGNHHKTLYLVKTNNNGHHIEIVDLGLLQSKKSFLLKQSLVYEGLDISLNESERYLILKVKITKKEYAEIQASWSKQSGLFLPQSHKHRFYAVDLTQAAGGLMPCLRMLTKIPHLGEVICAYQGNVMMITTRRWVVFWDIPTGKCDQRVTKGQKTGFLYRPDHLSKCGPGTSLALEQSKNGMYIAVGSEDGYMVVWEAYTGFMVGRKEPKKRHTASVSLFSAFYAHYKLSGLSLFSSYISYNILEPHRTSKIQSNLSYTTFQ
jgi:WD40 repeat protein